MRIKCYRDFSICISQLSWYIHKCFILNAAAHLMITRAVFKVFTDIIAAGMENFRLCSQRSFICEENEWSLNNYKWSK